MVHVMLQASGLCFCTDSTPREASVLLKVTHWLVVSTNTLIRI